MAEKEPNDRTSTPVDGGRRQGLEELRRNLDVRVPRDDQRPAGRPVVAVFDDGLALEDCLDSFGETTEHLISETFEAVRAGEMDVSEAEQSLQSAMASVTAELQRGVDAVGSIPSRGADRVADITWLGVHELIDAIPVPAFALDDEHTVIAYNDGTARLLGIDETEEIDNDCRDMVARAAYTDGRREMALADKVVEAPHRADEVFGADRVDDERVYTDRVVYQDTSTLLNKRGEEIPITFIATPIFDEDGDLFGVLELFEKRTAGLERFPGLAGVISHDIRNPLDVVNTYVELSKDDIDDEYYDDIVRNLDRIEDIIDDVMTFSRQADSDWEPSVLDLEPTARRVWGTIETGEARLETRSVTVEADRAMVERLLENLFENAVEHGSASTADGATDNGSGGVTVRLGSVDDGFYVEDTGPGIPLEDREAVFQHGYSTNTSGTGFGLSIVHKIAERHGWSITVTDSEEGGARFEISGAEET